MSKIAWQFLALLVVSLEDRASVLNNFTYQDYNLEVRISIHTGEVVAEVIGNHKFSYENKLGVDYTYEYNLEKNIKGKGTMKSYFLTSKSN